jgi:hypothetical protein
MFRNFFLLGIAALVPACLGQTTIRSSTTNEVANPTLPDSTYFRFFFAHITRLQSAADALKAQGKPDGQMRYLIRSKAHLTNQEDALLRGVALNCSAAYADASKNGVAAAKQLVQPYPNFSAVPPAVLQQISTLEAQRVQVLTGCMANLQSQMGPARYQMLRNFVVASEGPNIKQAASPPVSVPRPQ